MSQNNNTPIPVFKPFLEKEEMQAAVQSLEMGWLGPGSFVRQFEEQIAQLLAVDPKTVVAVNTGTSAVHLGLKACGVGAGDEVITPSFNNIADFQSIRLLGAEPVFCDIRPDDLTIDVSRIESLISDKTKAIICLDYGAALCDFEGVKRIADKHAIPVLYDAAHSFGSRRGSVMVGAEADYCTFSFDPVKNITCIDGGAVIIKNLETAEKIRYMRLLGQKQNQDKLYANSRSWTYDVADIGYRYHLANLHGAIGLEQLKKIETIKKRRQDICHFYEKSLRDIKGIVIPPALSEGVLPFIYVLRVLDGKQKSFIDFMSNSGIDTGIHWQPGHRFSYFEGCRKGDLSVTDSIADQIVTIPCYPDLSLEEAKKVVDAIRAFR
jgi:dTDP-4-amino-4,6-dideoxygalactose transaminase